MARYKVLRSVAHNLAHSFVSPMNYAGRDYVMCHLLRRVKLTRSRVLRLDLRARTVGPTELLDREIVEACHGYAMDFPRLVTASGAAVDMVSEATLTARVALGRQSATAAAKTLVGRITVEVRIVDDRGRGHHGRVVDDYTCGPLR